MGKIAIVFCLHGNEKYGAEVVAKLSVSHSHFFANEKAFEKNVRFIDVDLNKVFPGKIDGNHEERLAFRLKNKLKDFDRVLDLHSSSNDCPLFGIVTNPTIGQIKFAKHLGLKRLVIISGEFAKGTALIDHVKCGLSLEIGPHNGKGNVEEVLKVIHNLNSKIDEPMEIFKLEEFIMKHSNDVMLKNFCGIKKGGLVEDGRIAEKDFIPVLVNEEAYGDILCWACRKLETI
jgi:succinylglutamate desuccinylase